MSLDNERNDHRKTVLVLGAAGFVGRHACRAFADSGAIVVGLGHGNWSLAEQRAWGVSHWTSATVSRKALEALKFSDLPVAVVQCSGGGAVSYSYREPFDDFQRSVDSTAAVLEWIRCVAAPGRCRAVVVSSAAVYGDHGETDFIETSRCTPISPYGFHKLMAEQLCESYSRFFGVGVSIVRLFSVYGEGLRKQLLWDAMKKFDLGETTFFGTGHEMRDWIHVRDAARLLVAASQSDQEPLEIYNGANHHATTNQVLSTLARLHGVAASVTFSGETHTGNPRRLTATWAHARRQLGWTPEVDLETGLSAYAQWFRTTGALDGAPSSAGSMSR